MRRNRRGHSSGMEFGGSGEDSFVAVVVTKLTGALLFILLLTMVIMALLPKVVDLPASSEKGAGESKKSKLTITTPDELPEGIAGRPYHLAPAADGGHGHLNWSIIGNLPDGLRFEEKTGLLTGTPTKGTPESISLALRVADDSEQDTKPVKLTIYEPATPLSTPSRWKPSLPPIPWREWLHQGVGFLLLWLVHLLGLNILASLKLRASHELADDDDRRRLDTTFFAYKLVVYAVTSSATIALALWLWWPRSG